MTADDDPSVRLRETGTALRLQIFIGENDRWHRRPLHHEIVHRAHEAGLAGATVLHGIEGYGAGLRIHTTRLLSLTEDLPVLVIIVDEPDRIRTFLPQLDDLLTEALVLLDQTTVIHPT
ncbi:DUF190 domain-containing protein [Kribbella sp. GL6]|uniref:DUF190 domain-containing protein n=1 Tax=Kribbella sp. GL6 TaxID=3419765 RepID=UPI003CFF2740